MYQHNGKQRYTEGNSGQHEMLSEQVKSLLPGTQQSFGCGLITRRSQVQILPPPLKKYQLRRGFRFFGSPFSASPCTKYVPRRRISVGETAQPGKFSPTCAVRSRLIDMAAQTLPPVVSTNALLDVHRAAERLGVNDRFIRRLVEERRIPLHKVGKLVPYR